MVTVSIEASENLDLPGEQSEPETMENEDVHDDNVPSYELCREERIKENRERMKKLGIIGLSVELKALKPTPNRAPARKTPRIHSPPPPSGPARRSSRLQSSTPISYCELPMPNKDKSSMGVDFLREEGSKPELYTEEHEKLLGSTEMSWTLFVDGYGKDGKRIYDPVRGKTCHQCRQKTLGHRTHCSRCNLVQGQFCGDCLYMRYGENVLEANANPDWICPVCRGICNCSLCRQAKGWPPTGTLYRKISSLGYKSVAHYLILTRRTNTESDKNVGSKVPMSAKRSLPFSDVDVPKGEDDLSKPSSEYSNTDPLSEFSTETGDGKIAPKSEEDLPLLMKPAVETRSNDQVEYSLKLEPEEAGAGYGKETNFLVDIELDKSGVELKTTTEQLNGDHSGTESSNHHKDSIPETLGRGDDNEIKKEKNFILEDEDSVNVSSKTTPKSRKRSVHSEPAPERTIARRLRRRHNETNKTEDTRNAEDNSKIANVDSIASRLKMRRRG